MGDIGISIAGRKIAFDGADFYETPSWATKKLIEKEKFNGDILEPCSGYGAISKEFEIAGYKVISSDIRDNVYGIGNKSIFDYESKSFDNIITNPPYGIAMQVIEKSLEISKYKVAMLLKLTFLESEKRKEFFENKKLEKVYVFRKRVTMFPHGNEKPKNSGTITYAWFIWNNDFNGLPTIDWI